MEKKKKKLLLSNIYLCSQFWLAHSGSENNLALSPPPLVLLTLLRVLQSTLLTGFSPVTVKASFTGIKEKSLLF